MLTDSQESKTIFQSTPSVGRATSGTKHRTLKKPFQSTPSVGRATLFWQIFRIDGAISIHALRGEGDVLAPSGVAAADNFNPRPPWGGRHYVPSQLVGIYLFQSTPSVGRATFAVDCKAHPRRFQSTPSVGRATSPKRAGSRYRSTISIHALRGEGDLGVRQEFTRDANFNPRPPWGGRRSVHYLTNPSDYISIHALRGEGDADKATTGTRIENFNPRPPWGGRQIVQGYRFPNIIISIHALRGEGDVFTSQ